MYFHTCVFIVVICLKPRKLSLLELSQTDDTVLSFGFQLQIHISFFFIRALIIINLHISHVNFEHWSFCLFVSSMYTNRKRSLMNTF